MSEGGSKLLVTGLVGLAAYWFFSSKGQTPIPVGNQQDNNVVPVDNTDGNLVGIQGQAGFSIPTNGWILLASIQNGKMVEDAVKGIHQYGLNFTFAPNDVLIASVKAKPAERSKFALMFWSGQPPYAYVAFDLATGQWQDGSSQGYPANALIEPLSDGYFRCSIIWQTQLANASVVVHLKNDQNMDDYMGDGHSGMYFSDFVVAKQVSEPVNQNSNTLPGPTNTSGGSGVVTKSVEGPYGYTWNLMSDGSVFSFIPGNTPHNMNISASDIARGSDGDMYAKFKSDGQWYVFWGSDLGWVKREIR